MARSEREDSKHQGFPTMRCSEPNCEYSDSGTVQEGSHQRSYNSMLGHMQLHAKANGADQTGRTEEFNNAKEAV